MTDKASQAQPDRPLRFGTAEIAAAHVVVDAKVLHLHIRSGELNKVELERLIMFLQAKKEQLDVLLS